jgi:L-threonylcarbamoyladenylate synthase
MTERIAVSAEAPEAAAIAAAVEALRAGELVIFPTETVYGIGCDPDNPAALARLYEAKGWPTTRPIVLLVGEREGLGRVAAAAPELAVRAAAHFWPGPLTAIVAAGPAAPAGVLGEGRTVGVRMPDHAVVLALLAGFGSPLASTSANPTGQPAPAAPEQIPDSLRQRVAVSLESGLARAGVASTVVDFTVTPPRVLREGAISLARLREALGEIETAS